MSSPYLYSERHFRLYEDYLNVIVDSWPKPVHFTPKPPVNSTETLSSRIRLVKDALRKNIQGNEPLWKTKINVAKFMQIVDEIVVATSAQEGKVSCGPADMIRRDPSHSPSFVQQAQAQEVVEQKIDVLDPDEKLVEAICRLHHHRLLLEPSVVRFANIKDEVFTVNILRALKGSEFDVSVEEVQAPDGQFIYTIFA